MWTTLQSLTQFTNKLDMCIRIISHRHPRNLKWITESNKKHIAYSISLEAIMLGIHSANFRSVSSTFQKNKANSLAEITSHAENPCGLSYPTYPTIFPFPGSLLFMVLGQQRFHRFDEVHKAPRENGQPLFSLNKAGY